MDETPRNERLSVDAFLKKYILPFFFPAKVPNFGIVLLGAFGLSYLLQYGWQHFPEDRLFYEKTSLIGYSMITLARLLILLLVYVLITEHYKIKEHSTWGRNPGLGGFFISFLVGVPAMLLSTSAHNLFIYLELRLDNPLPRQLYYYVTEEQSLYGLLLMLLIGIVLPILVEELFFRGLVVAVLPDHWYFRILIPAILGTLFAIDRLEFIPLLIIGLCCSAVRFFTDSTLCSCLTRVGLFCSHTLLAPIITEVEPGAAQNAMDYSRTVLYASVIAAVLGIVMMLVLLKQLFFLRYLQKNEDLKCDSPEGKALAIPFYDHFHIDFLFGVAFLILCWITS
ncbi:MAG: hypothetical protein IK020_08350 [Clostridiales bacterium]|nr:hypothetical protein [Clostridiales bacterium]